MNSIRQSGPVNNGKTGANNASPLRVVESRESLTDLTLFGLLKKVEADSWTWTSVGALLGLGGGIISPLLGLLLTASTWFTTSYWLGFPLHSVGTVLCGLTFPLLFLAAHCLDLMEQQEGNVSANKSQRNAASYAA